MHELHLCVNATVSVSRVYAGEEEINTKITASWVLRLMIALGSKRSFSLRSYSFLMSELVISPCASFYRHLIRVCHGM